MEPFLDTFMLEESFMMFLPALSSAIPSSLMGLASYVLTSLALYTMASRRGLSKAWLSWVPLLNVWIIGSLSDQYRYVVRAQYKSKRKTLLILNLLAAIFTVAILVVAVSMAAELAGGFVYGAMEDSLMEMVFGPALAVAGLALPLAGVSIAAMVIRYMALYDIYSSMDPGNSVMFLVLSILFGVTEPFFLFFNRNKDEGMPPRKQEPVYEEPQWQYQEPVYETSQWQPQNPEQENKDYL